MLKNLTRFEFKRFLSIPIYVFNTSLGAILMALATIVLPFVYLFWVKGTPYEMMIQQKEIMLYGGFVIALFSGLNCTTYAAVSIDGQMHSFKKSLPISFEKNMIAKIFVNMLLFVPTFVLLLILLPFFISANVLYYEILLIFALAFATQIFIALFGLFANLLFIKLNWTNPTLLVKQSVPAFIYAMAMMLVLFAALGGIVEVSKYMSIQTFMLILLGSFTLLSAIFWLLIATVGKKKYNKAG